MMTTTKQNLEVKLNSEVDFQSYQTLAKEAVEDIKSRAGKKGQFLNWIDFLPNNQINNINTLYSLYEKAKNSGLNELAILGIGGNKNKNQPKLLLFLVVTELNIFFTVFYIHVF